MTDETKPETITRPPANNTPATEEEHMKKMRRDFDDLNEWLKARELQIVPGWAPFLPVGTDGITFQIRSRWTLATLLEGPEK